jgi:hypothetical protein
MTTLPSVEPNRHFFRKREHLLAVYFHPCAFIVSHFALLVAHLLYSCLKCRHALLGILCFLARLLLLLVQQLDLLCRLGATALDLQNLGILCGQRLLKSCFHCCALLPLFLKLFLRAIQVLLHTVETLCILLFISLQVL